MVSLARSTCFLPVQSTPGMEENERNTTIFENLFFLLDYFGVRLKFLSITIAIEEYGIERVDKLINIVYGKSGGSHNLHCDLFICALRQCHIPTVKSDIVKLTEVGYLNPLNLIK